MVHLSLLLLILLIANQSSQTLPSARECNAKDNTKDVVLIEFFNYGQRYGDTEMKNEDDHQKKIKIPLDFKFFNDYYDYFYISINGVCQLSRTLKTKFKVYPYARKLPIKNLSIVAPFWSDINTLSHGEIYHREVIDKVTLARIACDISRSFRTFQEFKPSWAYIITWHEVGAHGFTTNSNKDFYNTFQLVMATDGVNVFL